MTVTASNSLVQQAAAGTGLPASVVAAQINEESGGNANAVSPSNAQGEFQFLPSTYTGLGFPAGTEFDPNEEVLAYIAYMKQLLNWSGGNVQQALAGYNAGQANWQAGLGYANTILGNAKQPPSLNAGGGSGGGVSTDAANLLPGWLQGILEFVPGGEGANIAGEIADPTNWTDWLERAALMIFGGLLILIGISKLVTGERQKIEINTPGQKEAESSGETTTTALSGDAEEAAAVAA